MAKSEQNLGWPGFFRVVTVLCAILLLLARECQEAAGAEAALSLYEGLTLWAVPALFMLWGMFALEESGPQVSASLVRLTLPALGLLVFWGAVFAVSAHLLGGGALTWKAVGAALMSAAKGNTYPHLWILYPLIGLYLIHPVIHRFAASASRGELRYFLGLCFLFASLLPLWSACYPDSVAAAQLERLQIHLVLGWVGCYVGGWYLEHYTIGRIPEFILYILGVLGLAATVMPSGYSALLRQYTAPNVILTAAALCTLFRYVLGISEERARRRFVNGLGGCAFGVYLIYPLWGLVLGRFGVSPLDFPPALSVPLFAAAYFLLSLPFAWLISRIPGIGTHLT